MENTSITKSVYFCLTAQRPSLYNCSGNHRFPSTTKYLQVYNLLQQQPSCQKEIMKKPEISLGWNGVYCVVVASKDSAGTSKLLHDSQL